MSSEACWSMTSAVSPTPGRCGALVGERVGRAGERLHRRRGVVEGQPDLDGELRGLALRDRHGGRSQGGLRDRGRAWETLLGGVRSGMRCSSLVAGGRPASGSHSLSLSPKLEPRREEGRSPGTKSVNFLRDGEIMGYTILPCWAVRIQAPPSLLVLSNDAEN